MKRVICFVLIFASLLTVSAQALEPLSDSDIQISAGAALLMEKLTGEVIYEKNADARLPTASITKIMTMLLIVEDIEAGRIKPEDIVTAGSRAASFGGSCVFLAEGEKMSVDEMLKCIAVVSANDCAVAMAEYLCGTEQLFVERMNARAAELGLENTHFTNCTGLFDDREHYSSARDVALMSAELIKHEMIKAYTTIWMDSIRNGEFELSSTNKLVYWYEGCTGLKTGYTDAAKYCLSATAERDGVEYIAVVMRAESGDRRNADAATLLNYAFGNYTLCPLRPDEALPEIPVDMGRQSSVALSYGGGEYALVAKGGAAPEYTPVLPESVSAPVKAGDVIGELSVSSGGTEVARVPLCAAQDVPRLGFFGLLGTLAGSLLGL